MFWLIMGMFVLSAAGGAAYIYKRGDSPKMGDVLRELGMETGWSHKDTTPFYKWSWEQAGNERVSAEKIVRQAFQNARIWLDSSDLVFFKEQCDRQISGAKIDDATIVQRIGEIVGRTELLYQSLGELLDAALIPVFNATDMEARERIRQAGLSIDSGNPISKYGALELRRLLNRIGSQVLDLDGRGIPLSDPRAGRVFHLRGLDVWEHCLAAIRAGITRMINNRKYSANPNTLRFLKSTLDRGPLRELELDLHASRSFLLTMKETIDSGRLGLTLEQIERFDRILYGWKFRHSSSFKQADHNQMRELLSNNDLDSFFREFVLRTLDSRIESLDALATRFPQRVIFYGRQAAARSYAQDRYSEHLNALLSALPGAIDTPSDLPALLHIPFEEIQRIRILKEEAKRSTPFSPFATRREDAAIPTLDQVVGKFQRLFALEQQMPPEKVECRGWLIDLPLPEMEPEEFQDADPRFLEEYVRFFCDTSSNKDFESNNEASRRKQTQFFRRMIETLTGRPSVRPSNDSEASMQEPDE